MTAKRAAVWVLAALFGAAVTALVIYPHITLGPLTIGFGTTAQKFAYSNVLLMFVSMGGLAFIWLDYLLGANYLKK
ncbi:MAG: hypothetical protein HY784_05465 [Chloroflexi bacterium]|nr:hypothetical protein [Chloroflexota bacterium]